MGTVIEQHISLPPSKKKEGRRNKGSVIVKMIEEQPKEASCTFKLFV